MKPVEFLKVALGYSAHEVLSFLCNPEFEKAAKTHDWRNHIPSEIRKLWKNLGEEARMIVYIVAQEQADNKSGSNTCQNQ